MRRNIITTLSAVLAAVTVLTLTAGSAFAGLSWCFSDPVIGLTAGGQQLEFNVIIGVPEDQRLNLDAPIQITISVPANVDARVISMDGILPEVVTIVKRADLWDSSQGSIKIDVSAYVVDREDFPVALVIEHRDKDNNLKKILRIGQSRETISKEFGIELAR